MLLNEVKRKEEINGMILGLPNHMEEESEVKVTEEDLGLIKFVIEENLKTLSSYKTIKASFIQGTINDIKNAMKISNDDLLANDLFSDSQIEDEIAENLYQRMLMIEFPQSLMKLICSQYFLTETQGLLFIIEYLKFHILNHMFPEE